MRFIVDWQDGELSMAVLCRKYGISRRVGYKWRSRYEQEGLDGLKDRSRAPQRHPNEVAAEIEAAIVAARARHPTWGPKKLLAWLECKQACRRWPARSTIAEILDRHGLTVPRKRRRRVPPQQEPFAACDGPNAVWCADFKGWFLTADGQRCDPLTISDAFSRYLVRCQTVRKTDGPTVRPLFEAAFRDYGLPGAIRTDNGAPFASRAIAGLSELSVWWIKLGIRPERIKPGQPQQNGRHERMHLTLKGETARPPASTLRRQQERFDTFRREFNHDRPHEALKMATPASVYVASARAYPERLGEMEYPSPWEVRRVDSGRFRWHSENVWVSHVLHGELVGLEPIDDRHWRLWFGPLSLGVVDGYRKKLLTPREGRRAGLDESLLGTSIRSAPGGPPEP
jgi:transposase InsO family protein